MKFHILIFSFFISVIFFSKDSYAQNFGKQDLSNVVIDNLSDSQIQGLLTLLGGNNLSEKELAIVSAPKLLRNPLSIKEAKS
jgi:hypothetical protein